MKPYLPEWKLYLWKKLLLDRSDPERIFQPDGFVFFNQSDRRIVISARAQKDFDRINFARLGVSGGTAGVNNLTGIPISQEYYNFDPHEAMLALIELAKEKPSCLEFRDIELRKNFINKYQGKRREYVSMERRKHIADLSMSHGGGSGFVMDSRYTDPFCGLSESVYKKVDADEKLTFDELVEITRQYPGDLVYPSLYFKIQTNKKNLSAHLNAYLDDFIKGKLLQPWGVRFFKFEDQKNSVLTSIQSFAAQYGNTNLAFSPGEIAERGGWMVSMTEDNYRFSETVFALEKMGYLEITLLRGDETIISFFGEPSSQEKIPSEIIEGRPNEKDYEKYSSATEDVELKTLDVKIQGNYLIHKREKSQRINSTDRAIIDNLYYKYIKENERCTKIDVLANELGKATGYIRNRISFINQEIRNLVVGKGRKTTIGDFIKEETGRGYRLNPRFVIQFTKKE